MTPRGNPYLKVRMEPELLDSLRSALPSEKGKSSGISQAVRKVLCVLLDEPIPRQYGEEDRDKVLDDLEVRVRTLESEGDSYPGELVNQVLQLLDSPDNDRVTTLRLQVLLGRMTFLEWQLDHT